MFSNKKISISLLIIFHFFYSGTLSAQDVAVNISGPSGATLGSAVTYKIYVTNNSYTTATNVNVKAPMAANFTTSTISCASGAGNGGSSSCPASTTLALLQGAGLVIPSLPSGSAVVFTVNGTASSIAATINYTATVTFASDSDTTNNSATFTTAVASNTGLTQSVYRLNITQTLAQNTVAINGGILNLVYSLESGSAIPALGSSFVVPVTYTDLNNKNGVDNQWASLRLEGSDLLLGVNSTDGGTGSVYNSLPALNRRVSPNPYYPIPFPAPVLIDRTITEFLRNVDIEPLGTFTLGIGNLPALPTGVRVVTEGFNVQSMFAANLNSTDIYSGYGVKAIMQHASLVSSTASSYSLESEMELGQNYMYRYTAFRGAGAGITANNRGVIFKNTNSITFVSSTPCTISTLNPDSDGDGVADDCDYDDDNDGILDAIESPNCFYSSTEAHYITNVTSSFNGNTGDPTAGNKITTLHNQINPDTAPFNFAGQAITSGTPIFTILYPTRVLLTSLGVTQSANGIAPASRFGRLFGSNDGVNYTAISSATAVALNAASLSFTVTSSTPYRYYQIRYTGTSSSNTTSGTLGTADIQEITAVYNTAGYIPSANPKPESCISDADSDGIPNHQDLDSDGDGCADVIEGGANFAIGASYISNDRLNTTVNANGVPAVPASTTGYTQAAGQTVAQAFDKMKSDCLDGDGDGVPNWEDLDNDNDGILDTVEGYCESQTVYTLDQTATLAAATIGANGGILNLVYTTSGTPVAGLGTSFNIPFTYSDFNNTATAVNHTWEGFNGGTRIHIRPVTSQLYTSLPLNNTTSEIMNMAQTPDWNYRNWLNTGMIDKLGTFTTTIGNIPTPSNQLSSYSSSVPLNLLSNWNGVLAANSTGGYYARLQLQDAIQTTGTASTPSYDGAFGQIYAWDYTAFNNNPTSNTPSNSGTRGLITVGQTNATITFCNHRDTDGDGTPDYLDMDSDNDGCFDAIEGDENVLASHLSSGRITGAVNSSGVPNLVNNGGAADIGGDQGQGAGQAYIVNIAATTPTVSTPAATCSATGTATVTNYNATFTYTFSPSGPTVGAGGVISNATAGTAYSLTATSAGGCVSSSASFTRQAQLVTPAVPTVTTVAATCSAAGTVTISNYNATQTYTFSPTGPSVGAGGVISGATAGTSYTVTTSNVSCTSAASASFTRQAQLVTPAVPTVTTVAASCSAAGTVTVSNYNATQTYTFSPTGPSVGAGGVISGATAGTSYTVTTSNGSCTSAASASFTRQAQLVTPAVPTVTTVAATCAVAGTVTVSNYNATQTYTFSPTGPSVGAGGVISGATAGTSYTVTTSNASCTSAASASFMRQAQLVTPAVPTVTTVAATCAATGTVTVSNYNATQTYTFSPTGPTVGAGGVISGATAGTSYTVTTSNASCTSAASASFTRQAMLPAAVGGTASADQIITIGTAPTALNLAGHSGTIQWQQSTDNITFANVPSGGTTAGYSPGTLAGTTYYRVLVTSTGGCTALSNAVTITTVPDSDGDGINDVLDLDDDNDGILDKNECVGFIANNVTGVWKGRTASNGTVSAIPNTTQSTSFITITDPQVNFSVNQNGGDLRFVNSAATVTYVLTFSTPVPANEIGLLIDDVSYAFSPLSTYKIDVDFGSGFVNPGGIFIKSTAGRSSGVGYNATTGVPTFQDLPNPADNSGEDIYLKGAGNKLVKAVRISGINLSSEGNDLIAYSFFALTKCDADGDGISDDLDLDSDNDGCFDAIEGDENVTAAQLTAAGRINIATQGGIGTTSNVNNGVPNLVNTGGAADIGSDVGQGIGYSIDNLINVCCVNFPTAGTPDSYTETGISNLEGFANGWPQNVPNGFMAIESKNKGFVITRVASTSAITTPVEGMLVYDISANCVKLYNGTIWKCIVKDCN